MVSSVVASGRAGKRLIKRQRCDNSFHISKNMDFIQVACLSWSLLSRLDYSRSMSLTNFGEDEPGRCVGCVRGGACALVPVFVRGGCV